MRSISLLLALVGATALSGCLQTDQERALAGAAGGAIIADALDANVLAGAAGGALLGTYCDDLNIPGCIRR